VTVLHDFLPKHFVEQDGCANKATVLSFPEKTTVPCVKAGLGLNQQMLRERAKLFGRPKLDLQLYRSKRLGKKLLTHQTELSAAILTSPSDRRPTYAEMAARPPPQGGDQRGERFGNQSQGGAQQRPFNHQAFRPSGQDRDRGWRVEGITGDHRFIVVVLSRSS
jgi:hypothetical protein